MNVSTVFDAFELHIDAWERVDAMIAGWGETEEAQAKKAWIKTQWENPEVAKMAMRTLYWETEPRYRTLMDYHYEKLKKLNGKGTWISDVKINCYDYCKYLRLQMIAMKTLDFHVAEYKKRFSGEWETWITE